MKNLRIISAGLLMAVATTCMAQVTISTTQLNGTKWKVKGDTSGDFHVYNATQKVWHSSDGALTTYPYYLTNVPITSYKGSAFDRSKVGKNTKGRYIVLLNDILKITYCASIQSFDKTKGVFVAKLVTKGLIGTGDGIGIYEMVK